MHHETDQKEDTGGSGHYFVYRLFQEEWVMCDDETLTTISPDEICDKLRSDGRTTSALFYLRRGG